LQDTTHELKDIGGSQETTDACGAKPQGRAVVIEV